MVIGDDYLYNYQGLLLLTEISQTHIDCTAWVDDGIYVKGNYSPISYLQEKLS